MNKRNKDKQRDGYWEDNWYGKPMYKRFYLDGKVIGYGEYHYRNGNIVSKKYHI